MGVVRDLVEDGKHVLVAGVRKDNDREGSEGADRTGPLEDPDGATRCDGVALDVVRDNQDDQVGDGEEGNDRGVFERVEAAEEGQRDDDEPGGVSKQEGGSRQAGREASKQGVREQKAERQAGGARAYMKAVIQNCLSTRQATSLAPGAKPTTTPGIRSPMMIR